MNEERQLYLNMYFNIECINHLIQNKTITYQNCKYCNSLMTHMKGLTVVVVYDLYLECAEGRVEHIMEYYRTYEILGVQREALR